jgi:hypothetical protein
VCVLSLGISSFLLEGWVAITPRPEEAWGFNHLGFHFFNYFPSEFFRRASTHQRQKPFHKGLESFNTPKTPNPARHASSSSPALKTPKTRVDRRHHPTPAESPHHARPKTPKTMLPLLLGSKVARAKTMLPLLQNISQEEWQSGQKEAQAGKKSVNQALKGRKEAIRPERSPSREEECQSGWQAFRCCTRHSASLASAALPGDWPKAPPQLFAASVSAGGVL